MRVSRRRFLTCNPDCSVSDWRLAWLSGARRELPWRARFAFRRGHRSRVGGPFESAQYVVHTQGGPAVNFRITGLPAERFQGLFALSDAELAKHAAVRQIADARTPGVPCRVSLTDARPGDELLL